MTRRIEADCPSCLRPGDFFLLPVRVQGPASGRVRALLREVDSLTVCSFPCGRGRTAFACEAPLQGDWEADLDLEEDGVLVDRRRLRIPILSTEPPWQPGWDLPRVEDPGPGDGQFEGVVRWGPRPDTRVTMDGIVSYDFLHVEGEVRGGFLKADGTAWEFTHRRPLGETLALAGVLLVLAPLILPALALVILWERARGAATPGARLTVDVPPRLARLPEGVARQIRARLRELGCPQPHVQKP